MNLSRINSCLPLALLTLVLAGCCTGYQPPQRPVAYMVPTVVSGTSLRGLPKQDITEAELRAALEEAGLWEDMVRLGMSPMELKIVRRGLKNRGYAELDARRCPGSTVQCVIFTVADGGVHLEVLGASGDGGWDD